MLPEQRAYIHAWVDGVVRGGYRAGVYCSGIPSRESAAVSVVTANDIRDHDGGRDIHFFVSNDQCGPSPGCVFPEAAASSRRERRVFRRRMAVRAISAASGDDGSLPPNLCARRQLLSASHACQFRCAC